MYKDAYRTTESNAEFLSAVAVADWLISADVFVCVAIWDIYSRIDTRLNLKFSLPS